MNSIAVTDRSHMILASSAPEQRYPSPSPSHSPALGADAIVPTWQSSERSSTSPTRVVARAQSSGVMAPIAVSEQSSPVTGPPGRTNSFMGTQRVRSVGHAAPPPMNYTNPPGQSPSSPNSATSTPAVGSAPVGGWTTVKRPSISVANYTQPPPPQVRKIQ